MPAALRAHSRVGGAADRAPVITRLWAIVSLVVVASIVTHGIAATPVMRSLYRACAWRPRVGLRSSDLCISGKVSQLKNRALVYQLTSRVGATAR